MRDRTNQIGGAVLAFGGIGATALLTVASTSDEAAAHDWNKPWFVFLFALFALLAVSGLYIVCAGAIDWLPPRRWSKPDDSTVSWDSYDQPNRSASPPRERPRRLAPQKSFRVARPGHVPIDPETAAGLDQAADDLRAEVVKTFDANAFIDIEPSYLVRMFREYTDVQAHRIFEPYIGKWTRVSGPLDNVSPAQADHVLAAIQRYDDDEGDQILYWLFLIFSRNAADGLELIPKGQPISIVGQIQRCDASGLTLSSCKLDPEADPASTPPQPDRTRVQQLRQVRDESRQDAPGSEY